MSVVSRRTNGGSSRKARSTAKATEERRRSEARSQPLFENMAEGFAYCRVVFDDGKAADFVYLAVNKAFERLTGLKDVVGRKVSEVIPGIRELDPQLFEIYGRVAANGQPERFEIYVKALGDWFSISVYSPVPEHFVALFEVITARKQVEEEAHRSRAQLEQRVRDRTAQLEAAVKELEAFSYSVSHDLRAPLRAIDGFANILMDEYAGQFQGDGLHALEVIRKEAGRMGQLINDLLAFSRVGRGELQSATIDMTSLARTAYDECAAHVPERNLRLKLDPLLPACGDPSLVRQVLTNLLSNSIKYTRPRELGQIELGCQADGTEVAYWVKDNGVGFDPKYSGKLFGIFQRLHGEQEFEGTGVGLALVQRIVHRHGGRVWGESKLNEGATFFFTLPRPELAKLA
jgi:signal transduction histidine kinase